MMVVLEIVFWSSLGLVAYVYAGYPLLLRLFARRARQVWPDQEPPTVTLIISAYNEERCIRAKLENCLKLDYPMDRLDVVVVSDASTDRTESIVAEFADRNVRLLRMPERGGKTIGLNAAVADAASDVVVFSDANAMYRPDAIKALVSPFADPSVGAVIGESSYVEPASDAGRSESLYWRYETAIKRLESLNGSVVGGDGAIYGVRRSLYRPMAADALSDFINPLQVIRSGYRCVYEPAASSWEETAEGFAKEFRRKVRIVNRAWRALMSMKGLMNPFRQWRFAWQLVSHKLLRWLVPVFMLTAFASNAILVGQWIVYDVALAAQVAFYGLALAGAMLKGRKLTFLLYVPYYFCLVNVASICGILEAYRGATYTTWSTARADN